MSLVERFEVGNNVFLVEAGSKNGEYYLRTDRITYVGGIYINTKGGKRFIRDGEDEIKEYDTAGFARGFATVQEAMDYMETRMLQYEIYKKAKYLYNTKINKSNVEILRKIVALFNDNEKCIEISNEELKNLIGKYENKFNFVSKKDRRGKDCYAITYKPDDSDKEIA